MKKNYFLTILMVLVTFGAFAQLGTTTFNTAEDNAGNYGGGWSTSDNNGTGFGTWTLTSDGGGSYIGGTGQSGTSFGLYSDGANKYSYAERALLSDLKKGEKISVNLGHTANVNGEIFLQLLDDGNPVFTLKFVQFASHWVMNDGDSDFNSGQAYNANSSISFVFIYNEDGTYSYTFGSGSGNNIPAVNNITGINSIKFQSTNQGGGENFGFNNLSRDSKYTIPTGLTIFSDADISVPYLDVQSGATLIIGNTSGTTVSGDINVNGSGALNVSTSSSLRVNGTSTGNITYNVKVNDTDWHLMSSPVEGEGYDTSWVDANLIDNTTRAEGTNVGIANYSNTTDADGDWIYATDGSTGTFATGQGYSIKRDATGSDIGFTGTLKVDNASIAITANDIGGAAENRWTLIGNPFTSYIDVDALLTLPANATALENSREALYIWNGTAYTPLTTGYIHPGQGFFVNSDVASTSITINQDMLSHQTADFYKSADTNMSINLMMSDGTKTKSTEINYIADKTTGLDTRFDLGTFTGASTSFSVYSHLVSDNEGTDFMRQALPLDFENQIIPIGINAVTGKEITFTTEALNLPTGIKVYLEDRTTNTFTRLDEANSEYKITLSQALNGIGRFYLHTSSKSTLNVTTISLENVSIYKADASTLRIVGLQEGNATVKLFNLLGKQMMNSTFKTNGVQNISLPQLATGVYFVQITTEAGKLNKKIILE
jgi:hypothetical protein